MTAADCAQLLVDTLADGGYTHATGVPCSYLAAAFAVLESPDSPLAYLAANREDNAVGLASGLAMAGHRPVVLMQNSGLGYSLNAISSFTMVYEIDLRLVISWRGHADDAVEHDVIGVTLPDLLALHRVRTTVLDHSSAQSAHTSIAEFAAPSAGSAALLVTGGLGR